MKRTILIVGAVFTFAGVLALADQAQPQPAASDQATAGAPQAPQGRGGRGRGQRPPADPRDMGGGRCAENPYNCADTPNPLPAANTVWLEEMTWMDVRDAMKAGKTTVIVATGGIEPNGPWLVLGKHNYVLHANCEAIARKMGNALCAPIIKLVPEGDFEPKSGHMTSPGTLTMREETFRAVLEDVARSLKAHGFKQVFFIGDSGGNQNGQRAVAEKLNAEWKADPLVAHIQQYYDYGSVARHMESKGIKEGKSDNMHDDPIITLNMFIDDPDSVRYDTRLKANKATINGVDLSDRKKATDWAKQIVEFRADWTIKAINETIANKGTLPRPARGSSQ
jgi:creatinine amidohydrolase